LLLLIRLLLSPRVRLLAEILFLRRQLALFQERKAKPRRPSRWTKLALVWLSPVFNWREALVIVRPETFVRWHREGFRLFWCRKSRRRGRPALPKDIRALVDQMARENPSWGEERIADELSVKLGVLVSPRAVRRYLQKRPGPRGISSQRWSTFVRNHAQAIVACDFFTVVTATFRVLHVFVAMEVGARRLLHLNVTTHPTAEWTLQQFRETLPGDHPYRFVIHDRDAIFSAHLDDQLTGFGVRVLKTPVRCPKANAFCERLIGTIRRECLDFLIPLGEKHLRRIVSEWSIHYNRGRPHSALGPGIPEPSQAKVPVSGHRHRLPNGYRVASRPVLGRLHHEYGLEKEAA
jgi:putative transposase